MTLGKGSGVTVNADEASIPQSVGIDVIDNNITLRMDIAGLVDFDAEIKKLEKNLNKTVPLVNNLEKKMNANGYEANVSDEIKAQNAEKLQSLQKKVADIESAILKFKKLQENEK